jgi:P-type Cu+ transporter
MNAGRIPLDSARPSPANSPEHPPSEAVEHTGVGTVEVLRVVFVAAAAIAVWFHVWEPFRGLSVIGIAATLVGGYPIFKEAVENIVERRMTMELSMTIALLAALFIREFFTALVIAGFVLVAEILESLTVGRGRRAIRSLLDFLPDAACVVTNGRYEEVPTERIKSGDVVLIKPGSRVPVDGKVVSGGSFVDESAITGESMPAEKRPGAAVYAGTINQSGALQVAVERVGRNTRFGTIVELVEEAERSKAPIQKTADRLAGYLVYFALAAALLTFIVTHNIRSTISVVIVAGACGIAAGTPLAILGAIGTAAKHGAIVKGGRFLEALAGVDTAVLDKTGTLTFGTPQIRDVVPDSGWTEREIIAAASIAERRSEHPLARPVLQRADELKIPAVEPDVFEYLPGKGVLARSRGQEIVVGSHAFLAERGLPVSAQVGGVSGVATGLHVARGGEVLGIIRVADVLRPEAKASISSLKQMGLTTVLLTGDATDVANATARELGVDEFAGNLLPHQKSEWVLKLRSNHRNVAMLGDGINDAPALAQANVGLAMGSGTDVARESADIVLIGNDLSKFVETIRIARKCKFIIMQNFYGTLAVDTVGVALAALGFLNPLLAAFIHVSSEMAFILNSTRMLPRIGVLKAQLQERLLHSPDTPA